MRVAKFFAVAAMGLLTAGCASTREERRAMDMHRCRSYGFRPRTDAISKCLLDLDLNRDADRRAFLSRPYGWGPGWYGAGWRYW
jgi:hypothetical protein